MIVAGFVGFISGLLLIGAVLILWFLGLVSARMLMISAFPGVMYLNTGKNQDVHNALVYLGYAAVPFVVSFVFRVCLRKCKWADSSRRWPDARNLGRLRLATRRPP